MESMKTDDSALLRLRVSSACPSCGTRHVVDVRQTLTAKPDGTYSIAGAWPKVVASETWIYHCTSCGTTGNAASPGNSGYLATLPKGACGHVVATGHYSGSGHTAENCPGCCVACQAAKDATKAPA